MPRAKRDALPHAKYGVDTTNIPDYIEPFVAYRAYNWDAEGVTSLNNARWTPKVAFEATCGVRYDSLSLEPVQTHAVPDANCTCGMYAGINMQHLIDIGYIERGIHGEVYLWGRLQRCTLGWRAQYAYPKYFVVPARMLPFEMAQFEQRMKTLIAFDVDIYIQTSNTPRVGGEHLPLWIKDYGYSQQGLGWIMEQRASSYAWKPNVKGIEVGDRVAVLTDNGGIGIVRKIFENEIYFDLFGKQIHKVPAKAVKWSNKNWRWETFTLGSVTGKF